MQMNAMQSRSLAGQFLEKLVDELVLDRAPGHGMNPDQRVMWDAVVMMSGVPVEELGRALSTEVVRRQLVNARRSAQYFENWGGDQLVEAVPAIEAIEISTHHYRRVDRFLRSSSSSWSEYIEQTESPDPGHAYCSKHGEWYDTQHWSCCEKCWKERQKEVTK